MAMKIVGVHAVAADDNKDTPEGQWCRRISNLERDCLKRFARPDTEIVMRWPKWGLKGFDGFYHPLTTNLSARCVYHQVVGAEKEGYDAAIIVCANDPLLREIRTAVDIPVIGVSESALHLANMLGGKFGAFSSAPHLTSDVQDLIYKYGLSHKCVGVLPMEDTESWLEATPNSAETVEYAIKMVSKTGRELIKLGAEVLFSTWGMLNAALPRAHTFKGLEKKYPNGFMEIDGVPLVDVYAATIRTAELLVDLKRQSVPWISRVGYYRKVTPKALESTKDAVVDVYGGYWDC